jgi:hypothetical protein
VPKNDEMTIDERRKYLRIKQKEYWAGSRNQKSGILTEMENVTKLDRKTLIRSMHSDLERQVRKRQRGRSYGPDVTHALRVISEAEDDICAERLAPNVAWLCQHLAAHRELAPTPQLIEQLDHISISTVRRLLAPSRKERLSPRRPMQPSRVLRDVPIRKIPWNEQEPGHFEVDLVFHCGGSGEGLYAHTLQMIDVATGWSERVALLGRGYLVMEDAFRRILGRLPFPVLELHTDNGREFFNAHLQQFWERFPGVLPTRSRPYHKNDNRFVEQKNRTLVRGYFDHDRFDTVEQVLAMNELFHKMWLYYNFFQPVMRLSEKIDVTRADRVLRFKRKWDTAKPPLDRLLAAQILPAESAQRLLRLRERTNPRRLRDEIHRLIKLLVTLRCAMPNESQNVYETLLTGTSTHCQEVALPR